MFMFAVGFSLLLSHQGVLSAADRTRGVFQAERAMEAVRSIRDENFALLTNGIHGVHIGTGSLAGKWTFTGASLAQSGYTVQVEVIALGTGWKRIETRSAWNFGKNRSGSVLLISELTNWQSPLSIGDWSSPTRTAVITASGASTLHDVLLSGTAAYLIGETATEGEGIYYVYDIGDQPITKASSGTFSGIGKKLALHDDTLYVLTGDTDDEMRIYDLTDPLRPAFVVTHNLSGAAIATSMAVRNDTLLIGSTLDPTEKELSAYYIPEQSKFVLSGAIQMTDGGGGHVSVNDIALKGIYAYLATSHDTAEIRVAGVSNATQMSAQASSGYNLSDRSEDGITIALTGTAALIGTQGGSLFSEFVMVNSTGSIPGSPPGPWAHEAGSGGNPSAQINDIVVEPSGQYAFLAVEGDRDFQILDLHRLQNGLSEEIFSATVSGFGQAVDYSLFSDVAAFVNDTQLFIYEPG